MGRLHADECAEQCHCGSGEHGGWQESVVVAGVEHQSRYVWHYESDETDGTAECCDSGCENACDDEQRIASSFGVDAQIFGITCAEKQGIKRFYQSGG